MDLIIASTGSIQKGKAHYGQSSSLLEEFQALFQHKNHSVVDMN